MSREICLLADTLGFMSGGGHFWVYLNWALGLRANGVRVHWLEPIPDGLGEGELDRRVESLRQRLHPYGFDESMAVVAWTSDNPEAASRPAPCTAFDQIASTTDLLINFTYAMPSMVLGRFRRTALVDIDPGLTQLWLASGQMHVAPHTLYFTTGETVGRSPRIPDCSLPWMYTPPCVALDAWQVSSAADDAPFTTVSGWYADEWVSTEDGYYCNDKRHGFLPFLDLPRLTRQPLELALNLGDGAAADDEQRALEARGWRIRHSYDVAASPEDYQRYIQASRGEFSAVKPSCVRLQNAWISDRTLCYLASGKPAVVQHTGPSRFLPSDAGLFRFRTLQEAAAMLELAAADYEYHSRLARALAEEYFDAAVVARRLLERALA
jgi:hypothetical protein